MLCSVQQNTQLAHSTVSIAVIVYVSVVVGSAALLGTCGPRVLKVDLQTSSGCWGKDIDCDLRAQHVVNASAAAAC